MTEQERCTVCGQAVLVMAHRGTGLCSTECIRVAQAAQT